MKNRVLVFILSAALAFAPFGKAFAFVVPAIALVPAAGGAAISWGTVALSAAVSAGTAIGAVLLTDSASGESRKIHVNPSSPQTVPSGWTPNANPALQPNPPATSTPTTYYTASSGTLASVLGAAEFSSATALCQAAAPLMGRTYVGVSGSQCDTNAGLVGTFGSGLRCATGYTLSGSVCNVTTPSIVEKPADSMAEQKVSGGGFSNVPNDPDTTTKMLPTTSTSAKQVYQQGTSQVIVEVNPTSNAMTITNITPNGDGTSQRQVLTLSPTPDAAGTSTVPQSYKVETVNAIGGSAATEPATGVVTCVNCATEATLQDLRTNGIKVNETGVATAQSAATTSQAAAVTAMDAHKGKFDAVAGGGNLSGLGVTGLGSYSAPSSSAVTLPDLLPSPDTCSALSLSWLSRSLVVDPCPVVNQAKVVIEWGMYVITFVYITLLILRGPAARKET